MLHLKDKLDPVRPLEAHGAQRPTLISLVVGSACLGLKSCLPVMKRMRQEPLAGCQSSFFPSELSFFALNTLKT